MILFKVRSFYQTVYYCSSASQYETPYMSEAVRQELRELYMGRIDTYPYYFYPVRRRGGMGDMYRPMMPLPSDLMNPDPRKYLRPISLGS